jgi:hypothetical protein
MEVSELPRLVPLMWLAAFVEATAAVIARHSQTETRFTGIGRTAWAGKQPRYLLACEEF